MYTAAKASPLTMASARQGPQLARVIFAHTSTTRPSSLALVNAVRVNCCVPRQPGRRGFSSTARTQLKEFFPPPRDAPHIRLTGPAWPHPVWVASTPAQTCC